MNAIHRHTTSTPDATEAATLARTTVGSGAWAGGPGLEPVVDRDRARLLRQGYIGAALLALIAAALSWLLAAIASAYLG